MSLPSFRLILSDMALYSKSDDLLIRGLLKELLGTTRLKLLAFEEWPGQNNDFYKYDALDCVHWSLKIMFFFLDLLLGFHPDDQLCDLRIHNGGK